jgi:hypothetical protein
LRSNGTVRERLLRTRNSSLLHGPLILPPSRLHRSGGSPLLPQAGEGTLSP